MLTSGYVGNCAIVAGSTGRCAAAAIMPSSPHYAPQGVTIGQYLVGTRPVIRPKATGEPCLNLSYRRVPLEINILVQGA